MPQDLLNITPDMLEKLMREQMLRLGGGPAAVTPRATGLQKGPSLPSRIQETYGNPPTSSAADYLDNLLDSQRDQAQGIAAPAAEPVVEEPVDTSMWDKPGKMTGLLPGMRGGIIGPPKREAQVQLEEEMLRTGRPKPAERMTIEEKLAAPPDDKPELERVIDENLRQVSAIVKNPLGLLEGTGYTIVQLGAMPVNVVLRTAKGIFNSVKYGQSMMGEADEWAGKITEKLTRWAQPTSESGKAVAAGEALPFELAFGALHAPGKILWPNNPDAQAGWRYFVDFMAIGHMGVKGRAKTGQYGVKGTVSPVQAKARLLSPDQVRKMERWYQKKAKSGAPPTVEEVKEQARKVGVEEPTIDSADQMMRNWEAQGIETPEGRVGPTEAPSGPTTIRTADGTTITVQPGPKREPIKTRGAVVETPEGTIGVEEIEVPEPPPGQVTVKAGKVKKKSGQIRFWDENGNGYTEAQAKALAAKSEGGAVVLLSRRPTPEQLARGAQNKAAAAKRAKGLTAAAREGAKYPWEAEDTPLSVQQDIVKLNDIVQDLKENGDPEGILPYLEDQLKQKTAQHKAMQGPPTKATGTFSREEAFAILKQVQETGGVDAMTQLASAFGVDTTGMGPREIMSAVGPELMKVEKRKGAIERVMRRGRENVEREPQGMAETPPAEFPEKAPEKAPAEAKAARPAKEAGKPEKAAPARSQGPQKPSREMVRKLADEEAAKFERVRPRPKDAEGIARWEQDRIDYVSRSVADKIKRGTNVGFMGTGAFQDIWESFKGKEKGDLRDPRWERKLRVIFKKYTELKDEPGLFEVSEDPVVITYGKAKDIYDKAKKRLESAMAAKEPQSILDDLQRPMIDIEEAIHEDILKTERDSAIVYVGETPTVREARASARFEKEPGWGEKRTPSGGYYSGFFGTGFLQDLYERYKAGDKQAGAVAYLVERYNDLVKLAAAGGELKGWDMYRAADARAALGPLESSIRTAWQNMQGGLGRVRTIIRAKTTEGQEAQARIQELNRRLDDIDAAYDRATRGEPGTIETKKRVGPGEAAAYEAGGIELERDRFGGYLPEESLLAERATTTVDATRAALDLNEERINVLNDISREEAKIGELEIVQEPFTEERPPVFEEPFEPIVRKTGERKLLTKAEEKFYENLYTEEDWLKRAAAEAKKREKRPAMKEIITPERLGHQRVFSALTNVVEQARRVRARKQPIRSDQIMAGFPKDHPLYQPLYQALKDGDMKRFDALAKNARSRLMGYSAEEGAPYLESPVIPAGEPIPVEGKPTIPVPSGEAGVVRDRTGKRVKMFEPPSEERGHVQFKRQDVDTQASDQQQWRRSMKDLHRQESPGLPGHFSNSDQFPRLFPEAPEGAAGPTVTRSNLINDISVEVMDRLIQEGISSRLSQERVSLPRERTMTEEGRVTRERLTIEERSKLPWGGATFEDVVRAKRADIWVKILNRMAKDRKTSQLDQITDVVREHMGKRYKTRELMYEAIADDIRDLPISKQIFGYTRRIKESMLRESLPPSKASPLEPWQIEDAVFEAIGDRLSEKAEGSDFSSALGRELEARGKQQFGGPNNVLNHLALKIFAKKFWDERYLREYTDGNPVKLRAIEMILKEGDSAPVAQYRLRQEFPGHYIPDKPERIAAWAGQRDKATGELTGYVRYIAEKMEDWGPDAVSMFKRMAEPIRESQALAGGPIDSAANIMRVYFEPILKRLDDMAGRRTVREKVGLAVEERAARREAKAAEEAKLRAESAEQDRKVKERPEDYNIIEVDEEASPIREEEGGPYPWDEPEGGGGEGGGTVGFMGAGQLQVIYEKAAAAIKKFMAELSETRSEKSRRADAAAGVHKFEGPEIQERWEKGYRASRAAKQSIGGYYRAFSNSLTRIYNTIPNQPRFATFIDRLKWLEKEYVRANNESLAVYNGEVLRRVDAQTERLTRRRLEDTFSKRVFLDDAKEMYDGGANEFPQGLTRETLLPEIERFNEYFSSLSQIEKDIVNGALEARKAAMKKITDEIVAEGKKAGYNFRDIFNRKNYYRHELMMYYDQAVRGGKKMKPSTYSWGMKRRAEGYASDIVTDVRNVDTEIMARLIYERDRLRVHNTIDSVYNIYDKIKAEADAKGLTTKEALDKLVPDGYSVYYFDRNHLVFNALTVSERLARKLLEGKLSEITPGEVATIRERMAIGPKREPWVIPDEIAATLDDFAKPRPDPAWWSAAPAKALGYWKGWKLLGPKRIMKFQFRNLTGDAEMHAIGNPSTFTRVKDSVRMLDDYFRKGKASPEILEWIDKGGMDTTFHWAEIGDFQRLWKWSEKIGDRPGAVTMPADLFKKGWNTYADWAKKSSDLREGTLRLASYLDYRDQYIKNKLAGKGEVPNNYGASNRYFIDELPDIPTKAFWLANELSGAYDLVSPLGRAARGSVIPFWSWKEITAKRYYRIMKNAWIDGKTAREIGSQFVRGAPYAALKVGKFALKASALMTILQAINHTAPGLVGDPDAEEKLPRDVQEKPHITFGKGHFFSQVGSASDLLDFFGMDIPSEMVWELAKGETDIKEIFSKWWRDKPMINHIFQSITPFIKIPADLLYGRKTYPDIMNPRGIRDPFEYIADQLDLGSEYRMIMDRPGKEPAGKYLAKYFDYQHEEDETAYFDWITFVNDFKKSRGSNTIGYSVTPKSNYLYWFKRARSEGDNETAQKMFKRYVTAAYLDGGYKGKSPKEISNGIVQSLRQSYKEMFPLHQMTPYEIADISKTMTEKDKRMLVRALKYWTNVIVGPEDAPGITAEIEEENQEE